MRVIARARNRQSAAKPQQHWRIFPLAKVNKSTKRRLSDALCNKQGIIRIRFVRGGMKVFYRGIRFPEVNAFVEEVLAL